MIKWLSNSVNDRSSMEKDIAELNEDALPAGWQWVNCSVFARVAHSQGSNNVFYKQFLPRNYMETPKAWFRGSRCERAIKQLNVLKDNNFQSPEVLCWGSLSGGREFMVTQAVDGVGVGSYLASYFRGVSTPALLKEKREIISSLGAEVGRLHQAGIVHGDLRPNNVLIERDGCSIAFHFIDNERNKQYRKIPKKLLIKNLVQIGMLADIDLTNTDRVRFLKAYQRQMSSFNQALVAPIYQKTRARLVGKDPDSLGSPNLSK
ncbi:lipopolysaccharide kinase InaA family protein [Oceanicoccus sp. KOV_DT_Chl]|uniref:lipopolysaccharide kinase InaA family protein n=1 Tax=Oceanicoccus sp. KOV_DT_Chl TaxID=1904639 RepID=UPI000C7D2C01|nr:lipopolysaccharide kinase InaA family protein [Oceanicoccus sp. KOV_DT_Chl]